VLVRLAARRVESPAREADGAVRVLARGATFEALLRLACDEIRQNARGTVPVLHRLLDMLAQLGAACDDPARRHLVAEQLELVHEAAERTVDAPHDRDRLRRAHAAAVRVLRATAAPTPRPSR
jgi:uncharacterized membrane protein